MPTPVPDRDCLNTTLEEIALAHRLGLEGRERILSRMVLGTPPARLGQDRGRLHRGRLGAL